MQKINGVEIPDGSILLEPRAYHDRAIRGFDGVVLYDYDLLVETFMDQGFSYVEAVEWIEYNTIRSAAYIAGFPKVVEDRDD